MRLWTMAKVIVFTGIMGVAVLGMACQNGSDERVAQLEAQVADLQQDNIRLGADMLDMLKIMEDMTGREALAQSRMDSFNKRLDDTAERSANTDKLTERVSGLEEFSRMLNSDVNGLSHGMGRAGEIGRTDQ